MKPFAEFIQIAQELPDWQSAIRYGAQPLKEAGYISEHYIDTMIRNVIAHGPYIVIMPDVAMPHACVEAGAYQTSTSLLKLQTGVMFPQNNEVHLLIVLCAGDNEAHMQLLSEMVDVLMDEEKMQQLLACDDVESIRELLV